MQTIIPIYSAHPDNADTIKKHLEEGKSFQFSVFDWEKEDELDSDINLWLETTDRNEEGVIFIGMNKTQARYLAETILMILKKTP